MKSNKPIQAIYIYEARQLFRSASFMALTAMVFVIGIYAIIYGRNEVAEQNRKIDLLANNIDSLRKLFADRLQYGDTTANTAGELIGPPHLNRPDGMAALSFGQRDIHKFAQQITNGSYFYEKYATGYTNKTMSGEIVNPFKLMSGHLDLGYVLLLIFPLYLILLCYNVLSAEREGGTLSLLGTQPVSIRKIVLHKLGIRFLLTAAVGLLLMIVAGIMNGIVADERWWLYSFAFLAYLLCWTGILSLIVSFKKNSGLNALAMVSTWLFFTMLLPAFLNALLNAVWPVSAKTELAAAVQKANAEVWALPKPVKTDSLKKLRPYYANAFDTIGSWEDPKFYRVNHYLTDYYIIPFEEKRVRAVAARNAVADKLNFFSPALVVQAVFNELAGSNMQQMLAYDTTGYGYFKQISRFTDDRIFLRSNRFTAQDLQAMPSLQFRPAINHKVVMLSLACLIVIGLILLLISSRTLSKTNFL